MGKKIFRWFVFILNLSFFGLTVYLLFIDGRNIPEGKRALHEVHASISAGIEMLFVVGVRIISVTLLMFSIIYFFDKRKTITLVHIIILLLTLLTTFIP